MVIHPIRLRLASHIKIKLKLDLLLSDSSEPLIAFVLQSLRFNYVLSLEVPPTDICGLQGHVCVWTRVYHTSQCGQGAKRRGAIELDARPRSAGHAEAVAAWVAEAEYEPGIVPPPCAHRVFVRVLNWT